MKTAHAAPSLAPKRIQMTIEEVTITVPVVVVLETVYDEDGEGNLLSSTERHEIDEIQMDGDGLKRLVRAAIKDGHMDQINAEIKAEFGGQQCPGVTVFVDSSPE